MVEIRETEVRWEPVAGIPPAPCGDFVLESQRMGHLILRLRYHHADLVLNFAGARALRVYWDGDAVSHQSNRPRDSGGLLRVENSHWLSSGDFLLNYGPSGWGVVYNHYRILSQERHIDIIASAEPIAGWTATKSDPKEFGLTSPAARQPDC